jgi:hypothetical protein
MNSCAVVIPIYKTNPNSDELFSIRKSLLNLEGNDVYWVAPESLDISYYKNEFKVNNVVRFDDEYFLDISGYNRLMLSTDLYIHFIEYEFILICQPDAVILKPELSLWLSTPYDYIGAPWPNGYSLTLNIRKIPITEGVRCTAFVGNGGLSLRRNKACIELIKEFDEISETWYRNGHAEDLYFSFMGSISQNYKLPNIMTAAHFSHDIDPIYLQKLTNFNIPFGVHAWAKYERNYWESLPIWHL